MVEASEELFAVGSVAAQHRPGAVGEEGAPFHQLGAGLLEVTHRDPLDERGQLTAPLLPVHHPPRMLCHHLLTRPPRDRNMLVRDEALPALALQHPDDLELESRSRLFPGPGPHPRDRSRQSAGRFRPRRLRRKPLDRDGSVLVHALQGPWNQHAKGLVVAQQGPDQPRGRLRAGPRQVGSQEVELPLGGRRQHFALPSIGPRIVSLAAPVLQDSHPGGNCSQLQGITGFRGSGRFRDTGFRPLRIRTRGAKAHQDHPGQRSDLP